MNQETVQIEIRRPGGKTTSFDAEPGIYIVGRDDDCAIQIQHDEVEGRHAILTLRGNEFWIEDLESEAGTYVEGMRVQGRRALRPGQAITVGPFVLTVAAPAPVPEAPAPEPAAVLAPQEDAAPWDAEAPEGDDAARRRRTVKQQIHRELVERLNLRRLSASRINREDLRSRALATLQAIVREVGPRLPEGMDPETLITEVFDEALGLGPLEEFLKDPEVTEIMVNGHERVYIEKGGRLIATGRTFMDDASVLAIIERIVSPIGRRIDESQPYVDARLPDGSRVNAIIHPLSLVGPCLTIRKFSKEPFTDRDLIRLGTMTEEIAEFARVCVLLRKNLVVSGGTGCGKTTLLNVLSNYLPDTDRILTIEDAAELRLGQVHVVRLEARPPNIEGKGAVTIRDLVRNALRMRPDRIVVGECRGGEALDMLQAMNTGHDGSLTTIHANSPRDVISRLETMVLMSGMDLPVRAIREQIASAIDVIVHEARFSDGSRKITRVTEVVGLEGEQITLQDLFEFRQTGLDPKGTVLGRFRPTGGIPTFLEDVASRGLSIDRSIFDPLKERRTND